MEVEKLRERYGDDKETSTNKITHKSKFHYFLFLIVFFFIYNFVIFKIDKFIFFNLEVDVDSLMGDVDLEIADVSWVMWIFNNI